MTSVTVDLNELRTLLTRVIPFAADSKLYGGALPVIETVYLQGRGNHLTATATDRYIVGMSRMTAEGVDGFDALVKLKDVRHILSTFKARKDVITTVTLATSGGTADGKSLTVTLADGLFADADDLTARYGQVDGEFPKITSLFIGWKPADNSTGSGYNPAYLAKFAHVAGVRGEPVKVTQGALSETPGGKSFPTVVQAGDYFLGAIMPVRLGGDGGIVGLDEWVNILQPPVPAPKAKPRSRAKAKAAA